MSLNKIERRERIKMRIRKIVNGTPEQPRMTVFRSNKQIYVQFIDDLAGVTLATASSLDKEIAAETAGKTKSEVAAMVGKLAAQRAVEKGIVRMVVQVDEAASDSRLHTCRLFTHISTV